MNNPTGILTHEDIERKWRNMYAILSKKYNDAGIEPSVAKERITFVRATYFYGVVSGLYLFADTAPEHWKAIVINEDFVPPESIP